MVPCYAIGVFYYVSVPKAPVGPDASVSGVGYELSGDTATFESPVTPLAFDYPVEWGGLYYVSVDEMGRRLDVPYEEDVVGVISNSRPGANGAPALYVVINDASVSLDEYNGVDGQASIPGAESIEVAGYDALGDGWSEAASQNGGGCRVSRIISAGGYLYDATFSSAAAEQCETWLRVLESARFE